MEEYAGWQRETEGLRRGIVGGVDVKAVAQRTGTPFMAYDEGMIENRMRAFKQAFRAETCETEVLYASKAFSCDAIFQMADREGLSLDVVSGGEMHAALRAGFPAERIYLHGNNKSPRELRMAVQNGIGAVMVDDEAECMALVRIAKEEGKSVRAMIRINPGIEAETHQYIVTSNPDGKFGVGIGMHTRVAGMVRAMENSGLVEFMGFHAHIGSQIFSLNAFREEVRSMTEFLAFMRDTYGIDAAWLDLGGGFAARYVRSDDPVTPEQASKALADACEAAKASLGLRFSKLMIEPGRSMVAEAGSTVYSAGFTKHNRNTTYVFVDGGMADNIRPALYGAAYECFNISRPEAEAKNRVILAGKCCESGDVLIRETHLPDTEPGDLILMPTTGAYCYAMSSNYNRLGRLPVVFCKEGGARLVIRGETYEDMERLSCDEGLEL